VRINCLGDGLVDGRPRYEPISLRGYDQIFEEQVAPISKRLGFPTMAQCIPGSFKHWENRPSIQGQAAYVNEPASFLQLGYNPDMTHELSTGVSAWGKVPLNWQNAVGSVILVREDKKPLLPEHAECLAEFCQFHLGNLFQQELERKISKKRIHNEIKKGSFVKNYHVWKARQVDEEKRNQISPYDVYAHVIIRRLRYRCEFLLKIGISILC
ncbi:hypothetical protein BKA66DRAFT_433916, partial [Pyrenochaeta sp. MPI-SDFR-AT-0127]